MAPPHEGEWDCYVGSLNSPKHRLLLSASGAVVYAAPGYVLYRHNLALMAQRFDAGRLELKGEPTPIPGVLLGTSGLFGEPSASASKNGTLACPNSRLADTQLIWFDRRGSPVDTVDAPPGRYEMVAVAPDSRRIATSRVDATGKKDIWVVDPVRGASRLTFESEGSDWPVWSRDGRRVFFISSHNGRNGIYQKPVDGSQPEQLVYQQSAPWAVPTSESPDGRFLAFHMPSQGTGTDIWLVPLLGDHTAIPYVQTSSDDYMCDISPDGRWAAYSSGESGTAEVYVQSFPTPGRKYQISTEGGFGPGWARGGEEIQYLCPPNKLMAVELRTSPTFQAGKPRFLNKMPEGPGGTTAPDGERSLVTVPVGDTPASSYTIMLNWTQALEH